AAGDVLERVEEVERRGVPVPPSAGVLAERAEEGVLAEHAGERAQDERGLVVAGDAEGGRADGVAVAVAHELDLAAGFGEGLVALHGQREAVVAVEEVGHAERLVEAGESLVLPGVPLL